MRMTLLHVLTVLLTVLLLLVRRRCALAGLYSGKRRSVRQRSARLDARDKPATPRSVAPVELDLFLSDPKYKRDPEIDVDSEEIGYEPLL